MISEASELCQCYFGFTCNPLDRRSIEVLPQRFRSVQYNSLEIT
jgi:hypothetical protein